MQKIYINLTNGIEALPRLTGDIRFIRIQSTHCEQKLWSQLILDLDYDFLMNVALGYECVIYDFGAKKPIPRALYQGVEFIKYALHMRWLKQLYQPRISRSGCKENGHKCEEYFNQCYQDLSDKAKKKLDYFMPFVAGEINIVTKSDSTIHDGNKNYYRDILEVYCISRINKEKRN